MLCILVVKRLKRRSIRERLHLTEKTTVYCDSYTTDYGEIKIFRLYSYSSPEKEVEYLEKNLNFTLHKEDEEVPCEYLIKAAYKKGLDYLKGNSGKSICVPSGIYTKEQIGELIKFSKTLYIAGELPDFYNDFLNIYGTLPIKASSCFCADYIMDIKNIPNVILPQNLLEICPKEISPALFAGLLLKENGVMI